VALVSGIVSPARCKPGGWFGLARPVDSSGYDVGGAYIAGAQTWLGGGARTLAEIMSAFAIISREIPILFPVHPRTRLRIADLGFNELSPQDTNMQLVGRLVRRQPCQ
jgi:hypothetical protein